MMTALFQILPIAFAAIAPTMIGLVVLFLSEDRGLVKAFAFILGKYLLYVLWGLVSLHLAAQVSSKILARNSITLEVLFLIFGALLLILAVRSFFGEDDPDAPPPKLFKLLDTLGPVKLFGVGVGLSLLQPRFLFLVLAGATLISGAQLSTAANIFSLLVLALLMIWPMLIPIVVFLRMDEQRETTMKSMRMWLIDNQRKINVVVMGIFGVLLLISGLTGIF
jgi:threonine/homoserine/homoserine lactone efflux protein